MSHVHTQADLEGRLWKELGKARYGMLGLVGRAPAQHFQPMTAFCEPDDGRIWFFTRNDTDLARAVQEGGDAMFVVQAKDMDFQACISGRLTQALDRERMDRYWNPVVAAWYPDGKDDPRLTLLRMELGDAQIWLSEANPLAFAFQIARSNLTHRPPNLGESATINLS
jgi:general stress protein 26